MTGIVIIMAGAIMAASLIVTTPVLAKGLMATLAGMVAVVIVVTGIATMLTVVRIVDRAGIATMAEAVQARKATVTSAWTETGHSNPIPDAQGHHGSKGGPDGKGEGGHGDRNGGK